MQKNVSKKQLEQIYSDYNKACYISPDPLEKVLGYSCAADTEIAALIASSLAYGNVYQILKAVDSALAPLGKNPRKFLDNVSQAELKNIYKNFKYRFTKPENLCALLSAIKKVNKKYGSLNKCVLSYINKEDDTLENALKAFAKELHSHGNVATLIPQPDKGCAFKRLNLFFRWMVRKDSVDLGVWKGIKPSMLIVPLDTHMYQTAVKLGFTGRKAADFKTAVEITRAFKQFSPEDPVRYDFPLTRFGIRRKLTPVTLAEYLETVSR